MRILLIYRVNKENLAHSGVLIKMESQKKALLSLGHTVDLINHDNRHIYNNEKPLANYNIGSKLSRDWYNYKVFFNLLRSKLDLGNYDMIYIRYPFSNPSLLSFCKRYKTIKPEGKILVEMPTFPYNEEFEGLASIYPMLDNYYRKKLSSFVDKMVHFGKEQSLFGIETIKVTNGIDFSTFPIHSRKREEKKIVCIAIAKWFFWHGLDRFLKGLSQYMKEENGITIELIVVGEGKEWLNLKKLSRQLGIEKNVSFKGIKRGEELDGLFDQADIGIGTLGIHRKNLEYNASLKHREFCARGIPFILSTNDAAFPEECGFVHYCASNDEAIVMQDVIALKEIKLGTEEIRNYGEERFDWRQIMKKIIEES